MIPPTLEFERALLSRGAGLVAGIDEVGRGALAGPVTVGVVVVDASTGTGPDGLTDSKLLSAARREAMAPELRAWARGWAVAHATAEEIDANGIIAALRLAALRALQQLPEPPDVVILDGSHDWLSSPQDLFADPDPMAVPPVHTRVKADQSCSSVAAASVLAKLERDALMVALDGMHPGYGLAGHKGYGSELHRDAIRRLGATDVHRRSWNLT